MYLSCTILEGFFHCHHTLDAKQSLQNNSYNMTKCWQTSCTQVPPFPAKSKNIYFRLCDTASHRYSAVLKLSWFQQTLRILEETKHRAGLLYCSKCLLLYFSEIHIVTNTKHKSHYMGKQLSQLETQRKLW